MEALRHVIIRHREPLRRAMLAGAVGVPLLFAAGALVVDGPAARRFLLLYVAPFFVAFFAWAWLRVARMDADRPVALAVDAAATVLGAIRFAGLPVPFSGHMLFYAYAGLTVRSARFLLLIGLLAAEATWYKLVVWRDPRSWALGIAAGAALAATRILIQRTHPVPTIAR
ncbi:MAG TPA: hypothetical protein VEQ60_13830 [Longimicrobium sp.]|nr:hypothetical protein [Longimicrobium sp.]